MRRLLLLLPALSLLIAVGLPSGAGAARLPTNLYPKGTVLTYHNSVSNAVVNCAWNLDCLNGAAPVMHTNTSTALGRVGGCVEVGHSPDGTITWAALTSLYRHQDGASATAASAALSDFMATVKKWGTLATITLSGATEAADLRLQSDAQAGYVVAAWKGDQEVEAAVSWPRPNKQPWRLRQLLRAQVAWALAHPWEPKGGTPAPTPSSTPTPAPSPTPTSTPGSP